MFSKYSINMNFITLEDRARQYELWSARPKGSKEHGHNLVTEQQHFYFDIFSIINVIKTDQSRKDAKKESSKAHEIFLDKIIIIPFLLTVIQIFINIHTNIYIKVYNFNSL